VSRVDSVKRLVVVADDLGRSDRVNEAIAAGHDRGIVGAASLMAGGEAFLPAVGIALKRPGLAVGIHATFCDGRAVLPPSSIPDLVDAEGNLEADPARAGIRYWRLRRRLVPQLESECAAQFDRIIDAGLTPTHADGHHHLHIHPLLFGILCRAASRRGVGWIRVPQGSPVPGRLLEWGVFGSLAWRNRREASRHGMMAARRVVGLATTGKLDEPSLLGLLERVGAGWNEIFVHPDLGTDAGRRELEAVTSPRVRRRIDELGIRLSAYGKEAPPPPPGGSG